MSNEGRFPENKGSIFCGVKKLKIEIGEADPYMNEQESKEKLGMG